MEERTEPLDIELAEPTSRMGGQDCADVSAMLDSAGQGECHELLSAKLDDFNDLRGVGTCLPVVPGAWREEEVRELPMARGLWCNGEQRTQLVSKIACLLEQFTTGGLVRGFRIVNDPSGELETLGSQSMAVLPDEQHAIVLRERENRSPAGSADEVVLSNLVPIGEEDALFLNGYPATLENRPRVLHNPRRRHAEGIPLRHPRCQPAVRTLQRGPGILVLRQLP